MSTSYDSTSVQHQNPPDLITKRRIECDLREIETIGGQYSPIIFASIVDDNLFHIEAAVHGPASTPYENGIFLIDIKLQNEFPFVPPESITFKRATMHPNIDECGKFISEILKPTSWTPAMTIKHILEHVWARLAVPDVDSTECDSIRAHSYRTNKASFDITAREYSTKYAAAT